MATERILHLAAQCPNDNFYAPPVAIQCDPEDDDMAPAARTAKYLCRYLEAQKTEIGPCDRLAGKFRLNLCPVPADVFQRFGYSVWQKAAKRFYPRTDDNLTCFEWEHSNMDFGSILATGLTGMIDRIRESRKKHTADTESLIFLASMEKVCHGIIDRANQCAIDARNMAETETDPARKRDLMMIFERLSHVPEFPARNFGEAVQCVFFCWHFLPDSIGLADRYLRPFYDREIAAGTLTRDDAKELLQELFLTIRGFTPLNSWCGDKGGQSHFAVGGYLPDGSDGFCDLSRLIIESMMELPLVCPEVTLRWTKKTPFEVFRFMLDCERHDKYKRIAFANDEPRIRGLMKFTGIPFEKACRYVMVGCNEPTFEGTIDLSGMMANLARSITDLFARRRAELRDAKTFDEFLAVFRKELNRVIRTAFDRMNEFNIYRAGDVDVLSSIFISGCVENACSCTRGGSDTIVVNPSFMGFASVLDSLIAVRQFVYEEKAVSMEELISALDSNWKGAEELRARILRDCDFYGNGTPAGLEIERKFNEMLAETLQNVTSLFGAPVVFGDLAGYHPHQTWFGAQTPATPDGRLAGETLSLGTTPAGGHDRSGLTSVLRSVAESDPEFCKCGSCVFNLLLERSLIFDDANFEKTAHLLESYFRMGGLHFQLNYLDREELLDAVKNPDAHENLRVRVSGFSGYFVRLEKGMQDDVIARTEEK